MIQQVIPMSLTTFYIYTTLLLFFFWYFLLFTFLISFLYFIENFSLYYFLHSSTMFWHNLILIRHFLVSKMLLSRLWAIVLIKPVTHFQKSYSQQTLIQSSLACFWLTAARMAQSVFFLHHCQSLLGFLYFLLFSLTSWHSSASKINPWVLFVHKICWRSQPVPAPVCQFIFFS